MKREISFAVDEPLLAAARARAIRERADLQALVEWRLRSYEDGESAATAFDRPMSELDHVESKGPFDRDDANRR